MANLGKRNVLKVLRGSVHGAYLDGGALGEILLPNRYVPPDTHRGHQLEVFLMRDSEDRLVATTDMPRAFVDDVARLRVLSVNQRVGAFLDWGLPKDLLLPFREQTGPLRVGEEVLVRVYLDQKTGRIVASMRVDRDSAHEPPDYQPGQAVSVEVIEKTPLGYKCRVEDRHWGLIYNESVTFPATRGQRLRAFVRNVRADGKIDLALHEAGYQRIMPLAARIVEALETGGGRLDLDDDSPAARVRTVFGVSKKSFKQALGKLYKARSIRFTNPGVQLVTDTNWKPGNREQPPRG